MNPIHWLEIIRPDRTVKHLSNHYILKLENKFMVFTKKPVPGLKNHLISSTNIVGKKENQYLVENVHTIDKNYIIESYEKGIEFYKNNQEKLQPFIEKMQILTEKLN